MKTRLVLSTVLFFSSLAAAHAISVGDSPPALESLDDAFRERRDFGRFKVALDGYRKEFEQAPGDSEVAWRLAMACVYQGMRVESEESEVTAAFDEGRIIAAHALAINPQCVPCHFWRAVNQVLYAERRGVLKMLFSVNEIRDHFKYVAEHDPAFAWGAAHRFLGIIDWKLPGIFGGDNDRARVYFTRSLEYGPDEAMNYQVYHEFLQSEGAGDDSALAVLQKAASLPQPSAERVESYDAWQALRALVERKREATRPLMRTASTLSFKQE